MSESNHAHDIKAKAKEREEMERLMAEFLAKGGIPMPVPSKEGK